MMRPLLAAALLLASPAAAGDGLDRALGKALFERAWVPAPSSTRANDGLGPLFDARACASCHPRGAQRGMAAFDAEGRPEGFGLVLALLRADGAPDPAYGRRLETMTLPGVPAEGEVRADRIAGRPVPRIAQPGYGALDAGTGLGLRVAPDLRGRGLLERVPDAALLALEDPDDRDGDGVRGRARRLPDGTLGRFGWKAAHARLDQQAAEAFTLDLGLSTPLAPEPWGDCTAVQAACRAAPHGREAEGEAEISAAILDRIVAYLRDLPAPAATPDRRGAALFAATGCAACHRPSLPLEGSGAAALFTDALLHDMGQGLADPVGAPGVGAAEWRTAPLAGLRDALARRAGLLHDGRAADVAEAVRWHGGEAEGARLRFKALDNRSRAKLVEYVAGL
ncbi:MAG TPA: di-heme oxidoredictase family protein [Xanthobacteraceae bacterium]|nr:di-heme oxidoredictase family protein [Xanthobacteraceae bacterium]